MSWKRASDLAARLRAVREGLSLTQAAFGELVGVTGQSVSDWENGRQVPSRSRLERLARQVGITSAVFREGGPDAGRALERARMPQETRTQRGPGRRQEDVELRAAGLRKDSARLDFLLGQIRAYRAIGRPVSPEILAEWEAIATANQLAEHDTPAPGPPPGPAGHPDPT